MLVQKRTDASRHEADAEDLMRVVGHLRRTVRRRVRRDWPHRPLLESELELLRLIGASPGLRVQEAASELGVAPNTVSTLVGRLAAQDLLQRMADPQDGRAARLRLTAAAARRFAAWRDRRQQLVSAAMSSLGEGDRRSIVRALPALQRLQLILEGGP
jgi:DNA-binding MarR family transcriptional regulator